MRRFLLLIWLCLTAALLLAADNTISIPLRMSVFNYMTNDNPTGSTPDPTDPNQFRASLTGNKLLIETQHGAVSFVVIQNETSINTGNEYFYQVSYDSVTCPITQAGTYLIQIGCWKTNFNGTLRVQKVALYDLHGILLDTNLADIDKLPSGFYIIRLETDLGITTTKFYRGL